MKDTHDVIVSILQFSILGIALIILLILSGTEIVVQLNQITRTSISSSTTVSSPPNTSTSQSQQILTEAQNDITNANSIITFAGVFIAILTVVVALASWFGIRELGNLQKLSTKLTKEFEDKNQRMENLLADLTRRTGEAENRSQTIEILFENLTKRTEEFEGKSLRMESLLADLTKRYENESQKLEEWLKKLTESQEVVEAQYYLNVATNAYKVGDNGRAIEYYLLVLKLEPRNVEVMERLGRAYSNLNDMNKAIDYLQQALDINPTYVPALRSLALCYRYKDKDKAIDYYKKAQKIDPNDFETWDFLGLIYRDNKQFDEAIDAHEQALRLMRRPETEFYLSILYAIKGNKANAISMAQEAVKNINIKEQDERIRPVWKLLIRAGVPILEGNEEEAYNLIQALTPYITTKRIYDAIEGHLKNLLEASGHRDWSSKFMQIIKVKEN